MPTRRDILRSSSLIALAPTVPGFLARLARATEPERDGRALVVIQLDGGNDGINTVVPFGDEGYSRHRKALRIAAGRLIKLGDGVGLHPAMGDMGKLLESGRLGIVPGVGYPNPSRSHFQSMAVWQTARLDPEDHTGPGWLGRGLDGAGEGRDGSTFIGAGSPPIALRGRRSTASTLERIEDLTLDGGLARQDLAEPSASAGGDSLAGFVRRSALDAYAASDRMAGLAGDRASSARYPETALGGRLKLIARLLKGGYGSRVFYAAQGGYDTHSAQLGPHFELLGDLSGTIKAFLDDLATSGLADRVLVLAFSEFGRRVAENGSAGTDHGASGPVFLAGPAVKPGLLSPYPGLADLDAEGDLKVLLDFRRIYAAILAGWLGLPADSTLGGSFEPLPIFKV